MLNTKIIGTDIFWSYEKLNWILNRSNYRRSLIDHCCCSGWPTSTRFVEHLCINSFHFTQRNIFFYYKMPNTIDALTAVIRVKIFALMVWKNPISICIWYYVTQLNIIIIINILFYVMNVDDFHMHLCVSNRNNLY